MNTILTRITFVGAIYLSILCLIPDVMLTGIHLQHMPLIGNFIDKYSPRFLLEGLNVSFYFGGTSLLIVVSVTMDTVAQIQGYLLAHQYEGLIKKSKLRGRRR
jgi:preprotein translocase subunit SecY